MTVTATVTATVPANGAGTLKPKDRLAVARKLYAGSVAAGSPMTGDELAQHLGVSDRWGRKLIGRFKTEANEARINGQRRDNGTGNRETSARSRDAGSQNREAIPDRRDTTPGGSPGRATETQRLGSGLPDVAEGERPSQSDDGRLRGQPRRRSWLDATITLAVALVAAAASYGHMLEVAMLAGEPLWIARAFPITVDGLVLAAIRRGEDGRRWLALGAAVSVAANVLAQFPEHATTVGPVVSAWPPIALYGTHRLLQGRKYRRDP